eukprot:6015425-Amphidinium_carterae.1
MLLVISLGKTEYLPQDTPHGRIVGLGHLHRTLPHPVPNFSMRTSSMVRQATTFTMGKILKKWIGISEDSGKAIVVGLGGKVMMLNAQKNEEHSENVTML